MFTGIVTATGTIRSIDASGEGRRLTIAWPGGAGDLTPGDSISVSGVCLTVERRDPDRGTFAVFLARETVDRSYLGRLEVGDAVNLERAMPADGRFDGHIVQGHVDGTATVEGREAIGEDWWFQVALPDGLDRYVVEKGSIAVDGISLTVAERGEGVFAVTIIPETMARTTLSEKRVGDPVHLEVDVLAKYVERLLSGGEGSTSPLAPSEPVDSTADGRATGDGTVGTHDDGVERDDGADR